MPNEKTIELNILAKTGQVKNELSQINRRLLYMNQLTLESNKASLMNANAFKNSSTALSKLLKGVALRFVGLQAIVTRLISAIKQLHQWILSSIDDFRSFDNSMKEVSTILTDMSDGAIYEFTEGIENMSVTFGKSVEDLSKGFYDILSAAVEAEKAMQLLNIATKASVAGLTDVEVAVDTLTSIMNSYGKTVSQMDNISDQLFQTVVRGKLVFEDLANAMGYVTPIAASLGVEFEEILAILSSVTRQGQHVDMAVRGLALLMQNIANPTKKASDAAMEYGVQFDALTLKIKGLKYIFDDINEAMKKHGSAILPELVANMRSYRVAAAAVSDEGLLGIENDLNLLEKAAGKTDEALSKMLGSAQREAAILEESMNRLEREIGESWHNVDIWWKKTQIWWGSLFTGNDPGKAVERVDANLKRIQQHYWELFKVTEEFKGKDPLFGILKDIAEEPLEKLQGINRAIGETWDIGDKTLNNLVVGSKEWNSALDEGIANLQDIGQFKIRDLVDFGSIKKYAELNNKVKDLSSSLVNLYENRNNIKEAVESVIGAPGDFLGSIPYIGDVLGGLADSIVSSFDRFAGGGIIGLLSGESFMNKASGLNTINESIKNITDSIALYRDQMDLLQPHVDYFIGSLDDASEAINNNKENIAELKSAIEGLKSEVETPYNNFKGTLGYEIGVFDATTKLDRAQQYTNMAMKFGSEYINEYNSNLSGAINTVYNYTKASEKLEKVTNELNDANKRLNIQLMKIQLQGMYRRRGNTRAEQRAMKRIQIGMLENRIDIAKKEQNIYTDTTKAMYDEAKRQIDEHFTFEQFKLWQLKDVRDDELKYLKESYEKKKSDLSNYRNWLDEQYAQLKINQITYLELLESVNPDIAQTMEDTYGINIPNSIQKSINKFQEWMLLTGGQKSDLDFSSYEQHADVLKEYSQMPPNTEPSTISLNLFAIALDVV